jgi:hypothetical protein
MQDYEEESSVIQEDRDDNDKENSVIVQGGNFFTRPEIKNPDRFLELYMQPEYQDFIIGYFAEVSGSAEIAKVILAQASAFNIPPALAFSLCYEESKFKPRAYNNANRDDSVDRGLFQLNSRSFPHLQVTEFYNPEINAYHGLKHLRSCLDTGGTEIIGLAMYNAGTSRVRNTGTPLRTLVYVSRILDNRNRIENNFHEWEFPLLEEIKDIIGNDVDVYVEDEKQEEERHHLNLVPLIPLGIH